MMLLTGCGSDSSSRSNTADAGPPQTVANVSLTPKSGTGRWYSTAMAESGQATFAQYCAACHGERAEATPNWRTLDSNGHYPPPPLNGSAHAWHHPLADLVMVIDQGGAPFGGVMPAWGEVLSEQDMINVIASFQSYWSDEIYAMWLERERLYREHRMNATDE
ncbi:MAG: c-type cytochrome [Saccharospirillum sp.]